MEIYASEIEASLVLKERSKDELLAALRADLSSIPGLNVVIGQPISHRIDHMLSGTRANIAIKIFGSDLYELRSLAQSVRAEMEGVAGVVDLAVEQQVDVPQVQIKPDRDRLATYGVSVREL